MPSYAGRMGKRMSQAPRLSIVMSGDEVIERKTTINEFLRNHVKTIATLVMILGTVLCIVLIVLVHKWNFESQQTEKIEACLDVAIVGSGLSGSYAAWRLRHSQLKLALFDMKSSSGGRFQTWRPEVDRASGVHGELGALFYLPQQHPRLNRTIHALNLTPREWHQPSPDRPTLFLRGNEVWQNNTDRRLPYTLTPEERQIIPSNLKSFYLDNILKDHVGNVSDPLSLYDQNDNLLYTQSLWNVLSRAGSFEGLNFIRDSAPWRSFADNGNAALLASLNAASTEERMTVEEGMDEIPRRLVDQFLNASSRNIVYSNRRLGCVTKGAGYYDLLFITTDDNGADIKESKEECTKEIILALPPPALNKIEWKYFPKDGVEDEDWKLVQHRLRSIESIPSFTAYFVYTEKFWGRRDKPWIEDITTDLPVHSIRYIGKTSDLRVEVDKQEEQEGDAREYEPGREGYLFMVANADSSDYDYFKYLMTQDSYDGIVKVSCSNKSRLIDDINRQVALVYGVETSDMPQPAMVMLKDWGPARYRWRTGVKWDVLSELLAKPRANERVFVVGDAYCPGPCQLWAEGALQTVDKMLETQFADEHLKTKVVIE